jgi:hypothetical protein
LKQTQPYGKFPRNAKPVWGVMGSLVISGLNESMVCRIIILHFFGYGVCVAWIDVSYRIKEVFQFYLAGIHDQSPDLG